MDNLAPSTPHEATRMLLAGHADVLRRVRGLGERLDRLTRLVWVVAGLQVFLILLILRVTHHG